MCKVIFLIHVSLDGFVAGPNGEMDWIAYHEDMERYSHDLHSTTDTAIYGRVTYQMMEGYWPTVLSNPSSSAGDLDHARWLETATKIVVSRTLDSVHWKNTFLIRENLAEEMAKLKQQSGKHMWLLGSPSLAQTFMRLGLIDEYRINVNPIVLGSGKPLFGGMADPLRLNLLEVKMFRGGVAALLYEPAKL